MTEKEKRFADEYAKCMNPSEAAKSAGYSERNAGDKARALLDRKDVCEYISETMAYRHKRCTATEAELRAFWSRKMFDDTEQLSDRIRSSELLAKSKGMFEKSADSNASNEKRKWTV